MVDVWGASWHALVEQLHLAEDEAGAWSTPDDPGEPGYQGQVWDEMPRRSVTREEGGYLSTLARGRTVLEIGTGLGVSTRYLAATARSIVTLDVDRWVQDTIWPGLVELGVMARAQRPDGAQFDLVFIDGNHSRAAVAADIQRALGVATQMLVFHDTKRASVIWAMRDALPGPIWETRTTNGLGLYLVEATHDA